MTLLRNPNLELSQILIIFVIIGSNTSKHFIKRSVETGSR